MQVPQHISPRELKYDEFVIFPELKLIPESLTLLEKSIIGNLILVSKPRIIIETGVYTGYTTEFMYEFMKLNKVYGHIYGFDIPQMINALDYLNPRLAGLRDTDEISFVPGRLPNSLATWLKETNKPIDFAIIDAAHDYRAVTKELDLVWPYLSDCGYIVCHDYVNREQGTRYAVDQFVRTHNARLLPLITSVDAQTEPHESGLAIISKPRFAFSYTRWLGFYIEMVKGDLLTNKGIRAAWKFLRPYIKRDGQIFE